MNNVPEDGLVLQAAGSKGLGVFAARCFQRGETVLEFAGPPIREELIEDFTYTIQVDHGTFVGASGGIDDYVNHCCSPSCQLRSRPPRLELVAMRRIDPGEEITFDYATCITCGPTLDECLCGVAGCRGFVGTFWDLTASTQARFQALGAVPAYVLQSRSKSLPSAQRSRRAAKPG